MSLQDNLIQIQHNVETGEVIELPISKEQIKFEIGAEIVAMRQANATKAAAKAAAQAKLAALGLTTDDLKALGLGGN